MSYHKSVGHRASGRLLIDHVTDIYTRKRVCSTERTSVQSLTRFNAPLPPLLLGHKCFSRYLIIVMNNVDIYMFVYSLVHLFSDIIYNIYISFITTFNLSLAARNIIRKYFRENPLFSTFVTDVIVMLNKMFFFS